MTGDLCCCRLRNGVGLTCLLLVVSFVQICQPLTIDQTILRAMKNAPTGQDGLLYDEKHQTVRVGLDMVYSVKEWAEMMARKRNSRRHVLHKRQAVKESPWRKYWPNGVIYFEIDRPEFSRRDVRVLYAAMEEWMRHTCVQFRPAPPHARNKIVFMDGIGCASSVGMKIDSQGVTLSKGCRVKGVVIHELGHVLGFNHEQTRPDRDRYVEIRWENIPRHLKYNFRKYDWAVVRDLGVPYDYLSIMHYGQDTFTGNGRVTIVTRDPKYQNLIGNRRGLSFRDIKAANILYNCRPSEDRCTLRDHHCPGEGFVSKDCSCWCPTADIYTHPDTPYYVCDPQGHHGGRHTTANASSSHTSDTASGGQSGGGGGGGGGGRSTECGDQNDNCQMWAERGECQNNPDYMHTFCRKACRLCDSVEPQCRDEYQSCAFWRGRGYCGSSSLFSVLITNNCRRTCGVCKTAPGPEGGNKTLPCERQCQDDNDQCQEWAARGECSATKDYMLRYCRKSCKACCTREGNATSSTA